MIETIIEALSYHGRLQAEVEKKENMKEIVDNDGDNASGKMSGDFPYIDSATEIKCSTNPTTFKVKYRNTYLVG